MIAPAARFCRAVRSANERIDDAHAGVHKIAAISRRDRQAMDGRSCCDQAILERHRFSSAAEARQQFRPSETCIRVPWETVETPDPRVEPILQGRPFPSLGKNENPESQFPENYRINNNVCLMRAQPFEDARIGHWLGRFAQYIGIHQVLHNVSVDSESIGTKKSFRGQASSQSMAPSFWGGVRRTSR